MRLPATGLTLPWQLVAAHEPGPMYFTDSPLESWSFAAAAAVSADWAGPSFAAAIRTLEASSGKSATQSVARCQQDFGAICIRYDGRSFAQLSFGSRTGRVVFFAAWSEKATGFYLQRRKAPVVCRRIRTTLHAGRRDLTGALS